MHSSYHNSYLVLASAEAVPLKSWLSFPSRMDSACNVANDVEEVKPSRRRERKSGVDTPNGLPVFCRSRHFNRATGTYSVPLWDFTSRWLPEELRAIEPSRSSASFVPPGRASLASEPPMEEGAEGAAQELQNQAGDEQELASESEESEVAWEGHLGVENRAWARGAVEGALILLRRLQSGTDAPVTYGLGVCAALIAPETLAAGSDLSLDKRLAEILRTRAPRWAVCALRSGHFAGAVFNGQEAVIHKAIHRYTVRAKAGGSQSACDGGKKVKSVGSSLRRYGEQRLAEEIKELMTDKWAPHLAECELILISVSKRMRPTLVGTEKEPFLPDPRRVRRLPFMIGKPTFEAVQAAYLRAASVVFCEESVADAVTARFRPAPASEAPLPKVDGPTPVEPGASKAAPVDEVVVKYSEEEDSLFSTLHAAAKANDVDTIFQQMDQGADPTARDSKGRVPYYLCTSWQAREAFRKWRGSNEDAWDWASAQVPEGITDETEQKKKDKEKEKKKRQKEKQKASKVKAKEEEEERQRKEEEERQLLEAAQAKCDFCSKPLVSKPFTRLSFSYCSSECVGSHRRQLQAEAAMKRFGDT